MQILSKVNYVMSTLKTLKCRVKVQKIHTFMSRAMRKTDFCLCENKGADQLRSNCEADQRLCFRYTDRTTLPLLISKISRF